MSAGRWLLGGLVLVAGCGKEVEQTSAYEPTSLAPARVVPDGELDTPRLDLQGTLRVHADAPTDQDLVVRQDSGAEQGFTLRSPTGPDLSALDGQQVLVSLRDEHGGISMALRDEAGQVQYLLETAQPGSLTDDLFGPGEVAQANDLGPVTDPAWSGRLWSAYLRTDTGDVELFPGEPQEVTLEGRSWRAVLVSSYELDRFDQNCAILASRLSYELLAVEPGTVDTTPISRVAGQSLVGATCTPATTGS